ncbi:MAG: lyase domain protein repeat-containing protein [Myxococcales bacterium]|nr:lyase domain protein repeat-containing protein [Myxococcales bacterium]
MRIVIALLVLSTGIAEAAPVATLAADLDGDGVADRADLDPSGALRIEGKAAGSVKIEGSLVHASMTGASVGGTPTIAVATSNEAIIVERDAHGWQVVARAPIGGVGLDQDYGFAVEATPDGVYRYQTRAGYHRCDGKPAYLFAEKLDGSRFRRVARIPTNMPANAPVIAAHRDASGAPTPMLYQARTASLQVGVADAGGLGIPKELDDGRADTMWREELVKSDGEGQFFTYEPRSTMVEATQIRIVAGDPQKSNRPRRLGVVAAHGAWHVELPDAATDPAGTAYIADLPAPIAGCISIVLESTYGAPTGTTAIGELEVFARDERTGGGEALLAHLIAEDKTAAQSVGAELARHPAAAATAIDGELAKTVDLDARGRLVHALLQIHDPAAGPILGRIAMQDLIGERDLLDVIEALGALGEVQQLHDLALKTELPIATRIAAVHAIKTANEPQRALLVDLAGSGSRELRHAVIEVLSGVPVPALAQAAHAQSTPSAAGDLWRAVTRRARTVPDERAAALAAITAALSTATDYEHRYRLVDGIAAIGDAHALQTLAAMLHGMAPSAETSAYKQVAAGAIALSPRPEALDLVVTLARDPDPGVRLAALAAIAGAEAGTAGPWHAPDGPDGIDRVIMTLLATDTWPEVRRRSAQTLGTRCERIGPARGLADAVERDHDVGVRGDALTALVQCHAAGIAELLARTWDDSKAPIELRQRAVDLSVALGDRGLATKLVGKFTGWRGASMTSTEALALVQNAAYAIGRLAPAGAADALLDALDDSAFPEIVGAAATSLGLLGPSCPAAAKSKLKVLRASEENQIAVAAKRAYAQCGK